MVTKEKKLQARLNFSVKFKQLLPQILACSVKNLTMFHAGVSTNLPTIIIPALTGISIHLNANETLSFSNEDSSWLGSLTHICQLMGSLIAGYVIDNFGRKRTLLVMVMPPIVSFIMLYYSNSVTVIFVAYGIIGIANGILQVACVTYTGEICHPSIRAVMVCTATVSYTAGNLLLYTLGSLTNWRLVSLTCTIFPILCIFFLLLIPETPVWLLSKNRDEDATKSLQWLRGWIKAELVQDELQSIKQALTEQVKNPIENSDICSRTKNTLTDFMARPNLIQFMIAILLFSICQSNGVISMTPYLVQIFKAFGMAIDANWSTVAVTTVSLIGTIGCATSVKFLGKRKICLIGLMACSICSGLLGIYATIKLPPHSNSFDIPTDANIERSIVPLIFFMGLFLFASLSIADIPWMYMAELFPFKTRGVSSGITLTVALLIGFINTKTYYNLEVGLSIAGAMFLFAATTLIFIPILYFLLPETEGVTVDNIQFFFSNKNHKITHVDIHKFIKRQKEENIER